MRARLDATDWRILKELQSNGRISNVDLGSEVGISPPPFLRRVRALEQAGMIAGYFGMLDEKSVGFEVIAFAMVGLHSQAEADLRTFENRVLAWPLVRECYMLSGEADFQIVGFEVIAFAMVGLHSQAEADLRTFENRVLAWPLVRECYMLSGEADF